MRNKVQGERRIPEHRNMTVMPRVMMGVKVLVNQKWDSSKDQDDVIIVEEATGDPRANRLSRVTLKGKPQGLAMLGMGGRKNRTSRGEGSTPLQREGRTVVRETIVGNRMAAGEEVLEGMVLGSSSTIITARKIVAPPSAS